MIPSFLIADHVITDGLHVLFMGRVIERLLVCLFGGLSLILGWNLFRVGVLDKQSAEFDAKSWKIKLQRVGPGVFFALFGATVLAVSLRSPLSVPEAPDYVPVTVQPDQTGQLRKPFNSGVSYFESSTPGARKHLILSFNTILAFNGDDQSQHLAPIQKLKLQAAQVELSKARNGLVQAEVKNADDVAFYLENIRRYTMNDPSLSPEDVSRLKKVAPLMEQTLVDE